MDVIQIVTWYLDAGGDGSHQNSLRHIQMPFYVTSSETGASVVEWTRRFHNSSLLCPSLTTMSQQSNPHNVLLHPPFFVIPNISPTSPISQQTEQIDQLNTLLLQEIDENFAKFHQIITSKILPQIKRYAIAAEPVREGAKVSYSPMTLCLWYDS